MKPLSGGGARGEAWRSCASQAGRAAALGAFAIALMPLLAFVPAVWPRLALNALILVPLALATVRLPWRALFTPSLRHLGLGLMAAAALYGAGALVAAAL
ncbi:MAG TPA: hypothetical protein VFO85_02375, partial [Vicinamibacteria bacterium]|nr:hypothetical protein [Vicinamibacteria bacterium]